MSFSYYNDNDPFVCKWMENLINAGHLKNGEVDCRSIKEIEPSDLEDYSQHHFFAGIGGWALALKQAGWPTDKPVWTGSCPCQPFSVAGDKREFEDERHLWPHWFRLIRELRPATIFGEQVAGKSGYAWFDLVRSDLESVGYACGMVVSPAAGYGAPHLRHRIYFAAHPVGFRRGGRREKSEQPQIQKRQEPKNQIEGSSDPLQLALTYLSGLEGWEFGRDSSDQGLVGKSSMVSSLGNSKIKQNRPHSRKSRKSDEASRQIRGSGFLGGFWSDAEWLWCKDDKYRPTKPGIFPLVDGVPSRVAKLRAIGNAIVIPQAVEFIRAYMEKWT